MIFILLMTSVIYLCWLANTLFLEKYYIKSKTEVIYQAYLSIKEAGEKNKYTSKGLQRELEDICNRNNVTACIVDHDSKTLFVSTNGGEQLEILLFEYLFGRHDFEEDELIREEADYRIHRSVRDGKGYLEIYGRLSSGTVFLMSTPYENIRESAYQANKFFFYVGIFGTFGGAIIIWLVAGMITKPILELNKISEKMVRLDFDAKYEGNAKNEIGVLGENMNKLSHSLEETISELKSANNELQRDIEKKEKTDEMRRDFLANVSHELKTPIALICGYAEGLQEGIGDDQESRDFYCNVIMDEAVKMNRLVQKLLSLNELEFGREVVMMERFDLTSFIKNVLSQGQILAQKDDIKIEFAEYPPYHVWADEYLTEEVFQNYLSNAFHYCKGEKRVRITMKETDKRIRVGVYNTGDPIPEESLPFLWDKFYKVDKARTREYGGSGVGLSIVKAIMESMNQRYGVENQTDGVLFWFELECADAAQDGEIT